MQVDPKLTTSAVARVDTSQPLVRKAKSDSDYATFSRTEALHNSYRDVPDVRSDVVSKAKELVSSSTYPPPETIKRISNLLAMQLSATED